MESRKANWIGHILRRYSVLNYVVEVMTEVTRRRGRRRERLLGDLKEMGCWNSKEEAIDCNFWRTHCEKGCEPCSKTQYEMHAWMKERKKEWINIDYAQLNRAREHLEN